MEGGYSNQNSGNQYFLDVLQRIRDLEDRQKIINERVVLATKTIIEERKKNFSDIQDMKKSMTIAKQELEQAKDVIKSLSEQVSNLARKEELLILQRQFDLFRNKNGKN